VSKKILIIEDDHDILDIMKYILEDEGYKVIALVQAESIEEIIDHQPHLILLDERLPENPGHVLCARIKAHPIAQSIPIILVSAVANLTNVASDCKADNYIQKPFNLQDLTGLVNAYLQ
jgi:two-component system, OmpR family, phosphate regulon response regulator PhoB